MIVVANINVYKYMITLINGQHADNKCAINYNYDCTNLKKISIKIYKLVKYKDRQLR